MVTRQPTKSRSPFPPVPGRVTIHAVFDRERTVEVDSEGPRARPEIAGAHWLRRATVNMVRRVANWFAA